MKVTIEVYAGPDSIDAGFLLFVVGMPQPSRDELPNAHSGWDMARMTPGSIGNVARVLGEPDAYSVTIGDPVIEDEPVIETTSEARRSAKTKEPVTE